MGRYLLSGLLLLGAALAAAEESVTDHLLRGVHAFHAGQYQAALAEFKRAEVNADAVELGVYLGPTLYKLGRLDEARSVLGRMLRGGSSDVVAQYYLGLAYYRLGYLKLARREFATIATVDAQASGPKLAEGARQFVDQIDRLAVSVASAERFLALATAGNSAVALDGAEEAFLRATPGTAARLEAASLVIRLAHPGDADSIVHDAAVELHGGAAP